MGLLPEDGSMLILSRVKDAKDEVIVDGGLGENKERLSDAWCLQFFT